MANTKELTLKLNVAADPTAGSKALQSIASDAKKAEDAANRAGKAIADASRAAGGAGGGPTGGVALSVGAGGGGGDTGLISAIRDLTSAIKLLQKTEDSLDKDFKAEAAATKAEKAAASGDSKAIKDAGGGGPGIMAGLGKVAGGIAAVAATAEIVGNLTVAVQGLDNPMTTARDKTLGLVGAIPVLGGAIASLTSNVLNAVDRLVDPETALKVDQLRYEQPMILARIQNQSDYDTRRFKLENEVQGAEFRAQSIGAVPQFAYSVMGYDQQFQAQSVALQNQFPRGTGLGAGGVASFPSTRTLDIPGMRSISLPGMAGVGINSEEGGLSTLFQEQPQLRAALEGLQNARRSEDLAKRQAEGASVDYAAEKPTADRLLKTWESAAKESQRRFENAKKSDFEIGVSEYDKYRGKGMSRFEAGVIGFGSYLAPEFTGAAKDRRSSPLDLEVAAKREQAAALELRNQQATIESRITDSKEKQLNYTRQQYATAQAETGVMQAQLSILDSQISKAKSGIAQFGALGPVHRDAIVDAARRFKQQGRIGVTQEELGLLQGNQITGEWTGRALQRDAANDPLTQELFKITGQQTLKDLQQQRNALDKEITVKAQFDEQRFADAISEQLKESNIGGLLKQVVDILKRIADRKPGFDALSGAIVRSGGSG